MGVSWPNIRFLEEKDFFLVTSNGEEDQVRRTLRIELDTRLDEAQARNLNDALRNSRFNEALGIVLDARRLKAGDEGPEAALVRAAFRGWEKEDEPGKSSGTAGTLHMTERRSWDYGASGGPTNSPIRDSELVLSTEELGERLLDRIRRTLEELIGGE